MGHTPLTNWDTYPGTVTWKEMNLIATSLQRDWTHCMAEPLRLVNIPIYPACWKERFFFKCGTMYTSSTAQGGGGSFKNRKPIGEVGCCESGKAERSHWWIERRLISLTLSLCLSLFLSLSLTTYLPIYLSIYLSFYHLSIFQSD